MVKEILVFVTDDGEKFDTIQDAQAHEIELNAFRLLNEFLDKEPDAPYVTSSERERLVEFIVGHRLKIIEILMTGQLQ